MVTKQHTWNRSAVEPVILIAMERGSRWPSSARESAPDAIALAQQAGEGAIAFAERVVRRLATLEPWQRLDKAVLAVADDTSRDAFVARCALIEAALRCCADRDAPGVVIYATDDPDGRLRDELLRLADTLEARIQAPGSVAVVFGQAPPAARRPRVVLDTTARVIS